VPVAAGATVLLDPCGVYPRMNICSPNDICVGAHRGGGASDMDGAGVSVRSHYSPAAKTDLGISDPGDHVDEASISPTLPALTRSSA
jgi:hypothetical protein